MTEQDDDKARPEHSIEPADNTDQEDKGAGHEVDAPKERADDEVESDQRKTTKRQE